MQPLVLNPVTAKRVDILLNDLPQGLLLAGPIGVGLGTLARHIAKQSGGMMLVVMPEKDEKVDAAKGTISVESVRRLYDQVRTVQTNKLVIVIDYAERIAQTAQNALLKLLEEPNNNVHFILATHTPSTLLPTILSRIQRLDVQPISRKQSEELLANVDSTQKRTQILYIAEGLPAEIARLSNDNAYFDSRVSIVRDARDLLQAKVYRRLVIAHKYKDNRELALQLLITAQNIVRKSISDKPTQTLISQIESLLFAYQQIQANGNIRLCLARLVL